MAAAGKPERHTGWDRPTMYLVNIDNIQTKTRNSAHVVVIFAIRNEPTLRAYDVPRVQRHSRFVRSELNKHQERSGMTIQTDPRAPG
jgi:hypothetical protein